MSCRYPVFRKDRYNQWVPTPCKTCLLCRNQRREEWTQRSQLEFVSSNYVGSFITLTYRDDTLPLLYPLGSAVSGTVFKNHPPLGTLYKPHVREFYKTLNERMYRRFGFRPKHILVGEYGETDYRPHIHGLIFGLPYSERQLIYDVWAKGRVDIQPITHGDIRYTLSYIDKQIFTPEDLYTAYGDYQIPFCDFSNGIGDSFYQANKNKFDEYGRYWFSSNEYYQLSKYYLDKYGFKIEPRILSEKTFQRFLEDHPQYKNIDNLFEKINTRMSSKVCEIYGEPKGQMYIDVQNEIKKLADLNEKFIYDNAHHNGKPCYNVEKVLNMPRSYNSNVDLIKLASEALCIASDGRLVS